MTSVINFKYPQLKRKKRFKEFIFIGNSSDSVSDATEQLHLYPDSELVSQARVEDSLVITQVHTSEKIAHQLKNFKIEPGAIVKLVSKTDNGSVILSFRNKLIGIGADIASKIIATPAN